jgi:hypothetical protein
MIFLEEDAAQEIMVGPFVDELDGVTPKTGITWASANIELTKMVAGVPTSAAITDHGGAGVNEIAELQDGYYRIKLTAANLDTAGPAYITFRDDSEFLPVMHSFTIMVANAYRSMVLGTSSLAVNTTQIEGGDATDALNTACDTCTVTSMGAGVVTAAAIATDAVDADAIKADAVTEIQSGLATAAALTTVDTVVDGIKAVTDVIPDAGALTTIGTDTARLTAARAAVLTDWIDGGRLDLLLDAIPTTAMRGTDNAATAVNLATVDTVVDGIKAVTDLLPDAGALSSLATAAALTTVDTVVDAIKVVTDNLAASAATLKEGTAKAGTLSITQMSTTLTEADDVFNGRLLVFKADTTTAELRLQATPISDYVNANGVLTFTAITTAPSATETFVIS